MKIDARHLLNQPVYGILDPDYARWFSKARCIAWAEGYALAIHGSFTRDLDVVAIPWTKHACTPEKLATRLCYRTGMDFRKVPPTIREHGRMVWTMHFCEFGDPRWIDFSVMPRLIPATTEACPIPEK